MAPGCRRPVRPRFNPQSRPAIIRTALLLKGANQSGPYLTIAGRLAAIDGVVDEARSIRQGTAGQATTTPATRAGKGRAVQEQIVGADRVERMGAAAAGDELHVQQLLSANCFGDYYTRTGIDVPTRELLTFAMLSALGGCDPQSAPALQQGQ
jgi:4-carboxymuconolactone decarboxylase